MINFVYAISTKTNLKKEYVVKNLFNDFIKDFNYSFFQIFGLLSFSVMLSNYFLDQALMPKGTFIVLALIAAICFIYGVYRRYKKFRQLSHQVDS